MRGCLLWLTELLHAFGTLPRNPYLCHRLQRITRPRIPLAISLGYGVVTISHAAINWGILSAIELPFALTCDLTIQTTYLQQQACLFIFAMVILPLITGIGVLREKQQNRLAFVQLTPLSCHQIILGILSRELVILLIGVGLHTPMTIAALFLRNVEVTYVIVMTGQLFFLAVFFSVTAFLIGIFCHKNLSTGIYVILLLTIGNFFWHEILGQHLHEPTTTAYVQNTPYFSMTHHGIQLSPIRIQIPYMLHAMFFYYLKFPVTNETPIMGIIPEWPSRQTLYSSAWAPTPKEAGATEIALRYSLFNRMMQIASSPFKEMPTYYYTYSPSSGWARKANFVIKYKFNKVTRFHKGSLAQDYNHPDIRGSIKTLDESIAGFEKRLHRLRISLEIDRLDALLKKAFIRFKALEDYREIYSKLGNDQYSALEKQLILSQMHLPGEVNFQQQYTPFWVPSFDQLETVRIAMKDIAIARKNFSDNFFKVGSVFSYDTLYQNNLPVLLRYTIAAMTWHRNNSGVPELRRQLSLIEKNFHTLIVHLLTHKMPIALSHTHQLAFYPDIRLFRKFTFYNVWIQGLLIVMAYHFIYYTLFSSPPFYISLALNMTFFLIVGTIFIRLSSEAHFFYSLLYLYPLILLALYNMPSHAHVRSSTLGDQLIILCNPLLLLVLIFPYTCYRIWLWYEDYDFFALRTMTWLFLYSILSYEYARQWLGFRQSKIKTGLTAFGVMLMFMIAAAFTEHFEKFTILVYLVIIHIALILLHVFGSLFRNVKNLG